MSSFENKAFEPPDNSEESDSEIFEQAPHHDPVLRNKILAILHFFIVKTIWSSEGTMDLKLNILRMYSEMNIDW